MRKAREPTMTKLEKVSCTAKADDLVDAGEQLRGLRGYTPGDRWELYVGDDKRVQQMLFRRGGTHKPSVVIATWADYKKVGPLLISTDHRGTADGAPFRIFFSDVSVKVS